MAARSFLDEFALSLLEGRTYLLGAKDEVQIWSSGKNEKMKEGKTVIENLSRISCGVKRKDKRS